MGTASLWSRSRVDVENDNTWYDYAALQDLANLGDTQFLENLLRNFERARLETGA